MGKTPLALGIKRGTFIPPEGGWQEHTCYVVDVAYGQFNPIHRAILSIGFIPDPKRPFAGGYTSMMGTVDTDEFEPPGSLYYIKAVAAIPGIGATLKELP
jgi:hypothetical protein